MDKSNNFECVGKMRMPDDKGRVVSIAEFVGESLGR